jgi:putative ATPase
MSDPQLFDTDRPGSGRSASSGAEPPAPPSPTGRAGSGIPLAARMRPRSLEEYVGHEDVVGPGTGLRRMLDAGELTSLVLWGPPGCGKTSLARVVTAHVDGQFVELSAVTAGVKDVRRVIDEAAGRLQTVGRRTILFLDEVHRFNKAQQDALLPAVEAGTVTFVGATTENPYFELNAPLMSRCRLVRLEPLSREALTGLVRRAVQDPRGLDGAVAVGDAAIEACVVAGDGDARSALNALEQAVRAMPADATELTPEHVLSGAAMIRYDRGDAHYDQVSAFIKSMRGSDPDAAVYWLFRMLAAGEDPLFLARRMVILASEDVGLADSRLLGLAVDAFDAVQRIGLPEAEFALAHAALALAMAPKSNSVTRAMGAAKSAVRDHPNAPVPVHLRDAHSKAGRTLGHGEGYDYPHDHPDGWVAQQYLPDGLTHLRLYEPTTHGAEEAHGRRLAHRRSAVRRTHSTPTDTDPTTRRPT